MSKKFFRNISIIAVASLLCLAVVQAVWVYRMYNDSVADFQRRVESATYKSIYKAFRMDAIPGLANATHIKMNLDDFSLYFEPNLMELDALQPYYAEVLFHDAGTTRVMMTKEERPSLNNPMVIVVPIDDDELYSLRLSIEMPFKAFLERMLGLILSSVAIVLLLSVVLLYLVRTMFRQKTLEEMRRDFTHNITHELKTPITTISGYLDGMLDGTIPSEDHAKYMQIVSVEIKRLSRLVRSMLDISRLQDQDIPEEKKSRFELQELAGQVLITFEQKIDAKNLNVDVDFPGHPTYTRAGPDYITQVIYILLDNAVKFCPEGGDLGLKIRTGTTKLYVSISNSGETIPQNELALVFDRFHKLDKSRSQNRDGWGLGLYIVKTIIGRHGEDISVTSQNGITTFTFTLPLVN